jgi:hypothetical protein
MDEVLAIYGGDRTRWPAPLRSQLAVLIANSEQARKMLAEAEALDRLLDLAPEMGTDRLALLSDRIAAQAAHTPQMAVIAGRSGPAKPIAKPVPDWRRHAAGITALAASLVLGVMIGQNANVAPAMSDMASAAGIESFGDGSQIASTDEYYIGIDEDML